MGQNGGARPGAGRKPKRQKHATAIARAEKQIRDHLPELVDLQMSRARGVLLIDSEDKLKVLLAALKSKLGDNDDVRDLIEQIRGVFATAPDEKALEYLINRIMGKPTERKELSGELGITHEAALEELE